MILPAAELQSISIHMRAFFRIVMMVLVLTVVALVSALTAMRYAIHGREVAVPKLTGMTVAQAETAAQQNGLLVALDGRYYSADVAAGRIMSQSPQPGTVVRRGWRVRLAESIGPQRVVIPNVIGQSIRAAEINLGRRGLEPGTIAVVDLPGEPPDQVIAQDPKPNAEGVTSPRVNLLLTAPAVQELQAYLMPDFVGKTVAEAKVAITDGGFKLGTVTFANDIPSPAVNDGSSTPSQKLRKPVAADVIVRQTPASGQKITVGTTISLQVARP